MGLRQKLLLSLVLIFLPNLVVLIFGLHYLNQIENRLGRVNRHLMPSLRVLQQFENEIKVAHQTMNLNFYDQVTAQGFPEPWSQHLRKIEQHLDQMGSTHPTAIAMRSRLHGIQQKLFERRTKELLVDVPLIRRWFDREITKQSLLSQEELHSALHRLLVILSLTLILSAVIFYFVHYQLKRFSDLVAAIKQVAKGQYEFFFPNKKALHKKSSDEVDLLAREFNSMVMKLEKREQKLLESERLAAIGRLSAQVAHEIRNPLNAMSLNLELLSDELHDHPEGNRTIETLLKEIKRLDRITARYLEASRLKEPEQETEQGEKLISVSEAMEQADTLFKEISLKKNIALRLSNTSLGATIKRPMDTLVPVVINLIRNAIQSVERDGEIELGLHKEQQNLKLFIEDSGRGIPQDLRQAVLEPFYSTHKEGTGLGFSIVQDHLKKMGGRLDIKEPQHLKGIRIECDLGVAHEA